MGTIRDGLKTTEFWVMAVTMFLTMVWKDFPKESVIAIITWVVGRSSQKAFGMLGPDGKPAWKSTEFWFTGIFAIAKSVFPDLPVDAFYSALGYTAARTGVKIFKDLKVGPVEPTA